MEASEKLFEDKVAWLRKRQKTRRGLFCFNLVLVVLLAPLLWFVNQKYKQELLEAAQYQQDCARPGQASSGCEMLTMQVYSHQEENTIDPDDDSHLWLGLRSKSGQNFEVDTDGQQWHRVGVGDTVTATVWNGEVEEVSDSGGAERMKSNPVRKAEDNGLTSTGLKILSLVCLCTVPLPLISAGKQDEKQWALKTGNAPSK